MNIGNFDFNNIMSAVARKIVAEDISVFDYVKDKYDITLDKIFCLIRISPQRIDPVLLVGDIFNNNFKIYKTLDNAVKDVSKFILENNISDVLNSSNIVVSNVNLIDYGLIPNVHYIYDKYNSYIIEYVEGESDEK